MAAVVLTLTACAPAGPEAGSPSTGTAPPVADPAPAPDQAGVPSTAPAPTAPCPPPLRQPDAGEAVPADLTATLGRHLADARFAPHRLSASVWIEGYGDVAVAGSDVALLPASNQKLLTAMGALELLPHDGRFETQVVASGPVGDGALQGPLVLRAGGDPTLSGADLTELATAVRATGITRVDQGLQVDESRFDDRRDADGWQDWQRPTYVGSLSALVVDGNDQRSDAGYLADPAAANLARFADALRGAGVAVDGTGHGTAPADGRVLATTSSAPFLELVQIMLTSSDNMIAESLVKEIGFRHRGDGSTAAGLTAVRAALEDHCVAIEGRDRDGSGLSRTNARTADEWVTLLRWARTRPWWPAFESGLPLAGRTGTLRGRMGSAPTAGNVRAKTGSIIPGRALSGYATTVAGRQVVFSVVVNGDWPEPAERAIDDLIAEVVRRA